MSPMGGGGGAAGWARPGAPYDAVCSFLLYFVTFAQRVVRRTHSRGERTESGGGARDGRRGWTTYLCQGLSTVASVCSLPCR